MTSRPQRRVQRERGLSIWGLACVETCAKQDLCFNLLFRPIVSVQVFNKQAPLFQNLFAPHFPFPFKGNDQTTGCCPAPLFWVGVPPHWFGCLSHPIALGACPRVIVWNNSSGDSQTNAHAKRSCLSLYPLRLCWDGIGRWKA